MTDYPRFDFVRGSADTAHRQHHGAPLVDFVFRLVDRWRESRTHTSGIAADAPEIHERQPQSVRREAPAGVTSAAVGLFKSTPDENFAGDFIAGSARTQRLQTAFLIALVAIGAGIAVQGLGPPDRLPTQAARSPQIIQVIALDDGAMRPLLPLP